jgi:hypothetical protein
MKMSQRQMLWTIEGIPGRWATKTGGDVSADVSPVWDGGEDHPEQMSGPASADNVTLTRPVDDERDLAELKRLRKLVGRFTGTITGQPTNKDLFPIGDPTVYPDALLQSMSEPEYDASSSDPQTVSVTFAISDFV